MSRSIRASLVAVVALATALPAQAHGFGQRYDLPLPLSLYLWATALAVVLSFVVAAAFMRRSTRDDAYPRLSVPLRPTLRRFASAARVASLALFVLAMVAGFLGSPNPYQNVAPTLIWVIGWVGLVYVSAFIADVWPLINPWRAIFDIGQGLIALGAKTPRRAPWFEAERLGVWPAFALLFAFAWIELVYPSPALPAHVAWIMAAYSVLTLAGMVACGRDNWSQHGEVFTVVFGTFARFAPIAARGDAIELRPFAAGLLDSRPVSTSMTALVLLILATVLYDGVLGTPQWNGLESWLVVLAPLAAGAASIAIRTLGLIAAWMLFFGAYVGVCAVMSASARRSTMGLARLFAPTLIPIAIAYHLAHYLTYLLLQGQYIIPLLSDPFGYGWNLFGTAGYRVDIGIVGARFAWYTAVIAIVVGHVIAVYLAHHRALKLLENRAVALRAQVPLTALMVAYTFLSLSILAEPITERRSEAEPAVSSGSGVEIPPDAVAFVPSSGLMQQIGAGQRAAQRLSYRVLGSAFHDGSAMTAADLVYAYSFAYRWGAPGSERHDGAVEAATAPMRHALAAIRITGTDTTSKSFKVAEINVVRELFLIEVYLNKAPEDPDQDAAIAPPWSTIPWTLLALMEEAVGRGWGAFSSEEAARRDVPWLDLARSEPLLPRLAALVETFERDGYRPEALRSMVSADEARKRWAALSAFYREHHHFLVTNGPYQLKQWDAASATMDVFRDLSYPLGVGSYDAYAIPRRGFITSAEQQGNQLRLSAEIETVMKFQRSYELQRLPLGSVAPDVLQRAAPECRYRLIDNAGRVVLAGVAPPSEGAVFKVDLAGKLAPGTYTALAEVIVNGNAMNAEIRRIPVSVASSP
jgi:hypothetical protein